jgi:hypothetical protein
MGRGMTRIAAVTSIAAPAGGTVRPDGPGPVGPSVPALGPWALIAFVGVLGAAGCVALRRGVAAR